MEKRVAIVGAGISGLLACKYTASKGFNPVVFEAQDQVGGLWNHTIESTRLQIPKETFEFSDFPWPPSADMFPHNTQLQDYLRSYARNFQLLQYVQFNSTVVSIDYVGDNHESLEDMQFWELWGGAGKAFGSKGKWHLKVKDTKQDSIKRFSGLPDIPEFPPGYGPDAFSGEALHSVDYAAMDNASAAELIKGKRIAVIGSAKSAVDIAFECANTNDRWVMSKFVESYVRWKLPLKKYDMVPKESFVQEASSCQIFFLPENFYDRVEDGSIVFRKSSQFRFCREGLILDGEDGPLKADLIIFATGYRGDEKLKNIFACPTFQNWIAGSPTSIIPLYRQMIHPRIPQLAVIGYSESLSNLFIFEMRCKWLAFFLDQAFQLPSIKEMEKDINTWEKYMKKYAGNGKFRRSCIGGAHIWYNDQLCKDIGISPRRKKGFLSEFFEPYGLGDYRGLGP
ncbi:hypothetical protein OROMI_002865 [Orobanche minor]